MFCSWTARSSPMKQFVADPTIPAHNVRQLSSTPKLIAARVDERDQFLWGGRTPRRNH